ncbi:MAG: hypothetical protein V1803_02220 [Candidatus Roizmanbacteria bacterium]
MKTEAVQEGRFRYFSLKELRSLNEESISIVMGHKKLIILPTLTPSREYIESRKLNSPEDYKVFRYVFAGKSLESLGNISLTDYLGLLEKGFTDPSTLDLLRTAVDSGLYWNKMGHFFERRDGIPTKKNELAFVLPQFAYTLEKNTQFIPYTAAIFMENKNLGKYPMLKLSS